MKKIIKNKVYDTDTAQLIGADFTIDENGSSRHVMRLYRKKTGEFFLHDSDAGNISPLAYDEAQAWAKMYLSSHDFNWYFGDLSEDEDDGTELMTISIPAGIARRIRMEAQKSGRTISGTIAEKFGA